MAGLPRLDRVRLPKPAFEVLDGPDRAVKAWRLDAMFRSARMDLPEFCEWAGWLFLAAVMGAIGKLLATDADD